jgi:Cdc6-like AAA superfamily ATPase
VLSVADASSLQRMMRKRSKPPPTATPANLSCCNNTPTARPAGKSHTVRRALHQLLQDQEDAGSSSSNMAVAWVNCMAVSTCGEVFAQIAAASKQPASKSAFAAAAAEQDAPQDRMQQGSAQQQQQQQQQEEAPVLGEQHGLPSMSHEQLLSCLRAFCKGGGSSSSTSSSRAKKSYKAARPQASPAPAPAPAAAAAAGQVAPPPATRGTKRSSSERAAVRAAAPQQQQRRQQGPAAAAARQRRVVVVLDEVDSVARRSLADLASLFLLPHAPGLSLLLVGIANSIDLTERALPQLKAQAVSPALVPFPAYTAPQLAALLHGAVLRLPCKCVAPRARSAGRCVHAGLLAHAARCGARCSAPAHGSCQWHTLTPGPACIPCTRTHTHTHTNTHAHTHTHTHANTGCLSRRRCSCAAAAWRQAVATCGTRSRPAGQPLTSWSSSRRVAPLAAAAAGQRTLAAAAAAHSSSSSSRPRRRR